MKLYSYENVNFMESMKYYNYGIKNELFSEASSYNNVFDILPHIIEDSDDLLTCYKIGYCYMGNVTSGKAHFPLKRHCVIITPLYDIIDVTFPKYGADFFKKFLCNNKMQFLMFSEKNIYEYYTLVEEENLHVDLRKSLYHDEKIAWDYIKHRQLDTNDIVYKQYVNKKYNSR